MQVFIIIVITLECQNIYWKMYVVEIITIMFLKITSYNVSYEDTAGKILYCNTLCEDLVIAVSKQQEKNNK